MNAKLSIFGAMVFGWGCAADRMQGESPARDPSAWHAVDTEGAPADSPVRLVALSPTRPIPGQRLDLRGAGFTEGALVRFSGGRPGQRRTSWVNADVANDAMLSVAVPSELTGSGTLLVQSASGRSGYASIQYQDGRPQITNIRLRPTETVLAIPGVNVSGTLVVDGRPAGPAESLGGGAFQGTALFGWAGPHDVVVRFADGVETAPFRIQGP